jgi:hypothetical protein
MKPVQNISHGIALLAVSAIITSIKRCGGLISGDQLAVSCWRSSRIHDNSSSIVHP